MLGQGTRTMIYEWESVGHHMLPSSLPASYPSSNSLLVAGSFSLSLCLSVFLTVFFFFSPSLVPRKWVSLNNLHMAHETTISTFFSILKG